MGHPVEELTSQAAGWRFSRACVSPSLPDAEGRGIGEHRPVDRVARREAVQRRLLAVADLASAAAALILAVHAFGEYGLRSTALLGLPLIVLVAKLQGLYDRDALVLNRTTLDEAPELFQAATLYTLLVTVGGHGLVRGDLGAREALGLWVLLFGFAVVGRAGVRRLASRLAHVDQVLLIGSVGDAERLATKLAITPRVRAELVGSLDLVSGRSGDDEGLELVSFLEHVVKERRVDRIVVAPHGTESAFMLEAIRAAKALGVPVSVLPRLLEVVGSSVEFDHLNGLTVMGVRRFGLSRSSLFVKRGLDIAAAGLGLLIVSPLMLAIALAIHRSSAGPVLFRQRRVGKDGAEFELFKFRTMVDDAEALKNELLVLNEAEGLFKIAEDPRITPIGRLLRRSSLDELPQLFNVLRGEMSLVGPRPLVPEEDRRIEGRHRRRLHLKPGMTGQWQIFGSSRIPLREMVTIDYLYVANWSLWGDVKILCRTVPYVLARRGL